MIFFTDKENSANYSLKFFFSPADTKSERINGPRGRRKGVIMTVSTYQVDNVIKAYNKQNRLNARPSAVQGGRKEAQYVDMVSLSTNVDKKEAYQKISYSLLDVILKDRL
jgi:hypothetical protein